MIVRVVVFGTASVAFAVGLMLAVGERDKVIPVGITVVFGWLLIYVAAVAGRLRGDLSADREISRRHLQVLAAAIGVLSVPSVVAVWASTGTRAGVALGVALTALIVGLLWVPALGGRRGARR